MSTPTAPTPCPHHTAPSNEPGCPLQALGDYALETLEALHAHTRNLLSTVPSAVGALCITWEGPDHVALSVRSGGFSPAEVLQRLELITERVRRAVLPDGATS